MKFHPLTLVLVGGMAAIIIWLLVPAKNKQATALSVDTSASVAPPTAESPAAAATSGPPTTPAAPAEALVSPKTIASTNPSDLSGLAATIPMPVEGDPLDEMIKLGKLSAEKNHANLGAILPYLNSTNADVRAVAIEAVKQVGDHSTIPLLQQLAAATTDADERTALEDAAAFLAQPSLTEVEKDQPDAARKPLPPPGTQPVLPPQNSHVRRIRPGSGQQ